MADGTTLNGVSIGGGDVADTDDLGGSLRIQRVKLCWGADGGRVDAQHTDNFRVPVEAANPGSLVNLAASYSADQTDTIILTPASGQKSKVWRMWFAVGADMTGNVAIKVGFGTTNTPSTTDCFFRHPAAPGGFTTQIGNGIVPLAKGVTDQPLRITISGVSVGKVEICVEYE